MRDEYEIIYNLFRRYTMQEIDRRAFRPIRRRSMGTGIGLLSVVFFLFLMVSGAQAEQICSDCHDTGQHGQCDADYCAACHGNPPVNAGGLIHPFAAQTNPVASGAASAGAHLKHATSSGRNYACGVCHYSGMSVSSGQLVGGTGNGNGILQMGFAIPMPGGATADGGSYDGVSGLAYPYEATNNSIVTTGGTKTCSNIYCHSNGTSVTTGVIPAGSTSPAWTTAGPLVCSSCHGFPPSYAQDQPKSNSHMYTAHQQPCNFCHYLTTADGTTVTGPAHHVNGTYNVQPDPTALYKSIPVNFAYRFDQGGGYCDNVSCHGGANWVWGRTTFDAWIAYSNGPNCYEVIFDSLAFSAGATPPFTYNWDFGDGQTGTGLPASHIYAGLGPYYPVVTGRDANMHPYTGTTSGVYPQPTNVSPTVNSTIKVESYTVTLTDLSTDPDYNTCGHSGNGELSVNWKGRGLVDTKSVAFTDSPSNAVITRSFPGFSGTIDVLHTVKDNAGAYVSKTTTITVPNGTPTKTSITVTVTQSNGTTPISTARLYLRKGGVLKSTGYSNASGVWVFSNLLPAADYTVEVYKSGVNFGTGTGKVSSRIPVDTTIGDVALPISSVTP